MTDMIAGVNAAKYLMGLGVPPLPKNGAVAAVAVLYSESNLNPRSQGTQSTETPGVLNPRGAYGIASWNGTRQQHLKDFCDRHGLPYDKLESQLRFFLNECANSYPQTWAAIRSSFPINDIISVIVAEYEDPKDKPSEVARAAAYAAQLAPLIPDTVPPIVIPTPAPPVPPPIPTEPTPIPTPIPTEPGQIDMPTAVLGLLVQVLPQLFSILTLVLQHAATQLPPTTPARPTPGPVPPTPFPTFPMPSPTTGTVDWGTILQEILQVVARAVPPK